MYYGADYYPEHWPEERWPEDARLMAEAGFNVVRMAEFAWSAMEPREGIFDFDWLDRAIDLLGKHGIETVLGTPTASPPAWLMYAYPECFRVDERHQRLTYGHRRNYCPNNPVYRQYSGRIATAMAEHYADNPLVIRWQIDNEFGERCYCDTCQRAFQEWLRGKYGSLDALNGTWGTIFWSHTYTAWTEIPLPWATANTHNPSLALDYRRFMTDSYVDFQKLQVDILRRANPTKPITHNLMGFYYPNLDYFRLNQDLDFVSWDNYPRCTAEPDLGAVALSHDAMRGLKNTNFWVMEAHGGIAGATATYSTPRPGETPHWAWQAIAHGADGIVFFRWRTCRFGAEEFAHGILDYDGVPRRRYRELAQMGRTLKRTGAAIEGSEVRAEAALVFSYDSRFAFQNQYQNPGFSYDAIFTGYYRALWKLGIGADIVPPGADLSSYKVVVAPALYVLEKAVAERLRAYVAGGGTLVVTCRSGIVDEFNVVVESQPPGLLTELCGVEVEEYDSRIQGDTVPIVAAHQLGGESFTAGVWADILDPNGATELARYGADYFAGRAAVTCHAFGLGQAVYVGTIPDQPFVDRLMTWVCEQRSITAPLATPDGVETTVRESDGATYLFVLNGSGEERTIDVGDNVCDLISDEVVSGEVSLKPLSVMVLRRELKGGAELQ